MFEAGMMKATMEVNLENENTNHVDGNNGISSSTNKTVENKTVEKANEAVENKSPQKIVKDEIKKTKAGLTEGNLTYWNNVINKIKENGKMGIYVNLIGSTAREVNDMTIEVTIANQNSFAKNILETHENKAEIEKIASIEAGKTMNIKFVSNEDKKKADLKNNSIENMINNLDIPINIIDE